LVSNTASGLFDRFQGRLIWPIKDIAGAVLGFGARKLYDDDFFDAKYLNTAETSVYHKSNVLYGLDLARKAISLKRQIVVVEGYTDVMAMHLAGIETAVASCGTAFGQDHVKIVRRIMNDTDPSSMIMGASTHQKGKVIFTFDGDAAGLKAATKSFAHDQSFMAQTYVAIVPDGMDPCDLRLKKGDLALNDLVESAVPSFEFMINSTLNNFDIRGASGRIEAVRACVPIICTIRDIALRDEYVLYLSKHTGVNMETISREVKQFVQDNQQLQAQQMNTTSSIPTIGTQNNRKTIDKSTEIEMNYITILLQYPGAVNSDVVLEIDSSYFGNKFFAGIYERIIDMGGADVGAVLNGAEWISSVCEGLNEQQVRGVHKLSASSLPISDVAQINAYFTELTQSLKQKHKSVEITNLKAELSTLTPTDERYREVFGKIIDLEKSRT
jgi:DNA primase